MPNVNNVVAAKPKVAGAIYRAPLGTAIPEDATTELGAAFEEMGYVSEDGVAENISRESESIKAWGGNTVMVTQTSKEDTYSLKLIEALNITAMKATYGDDNVSGTAKDGLTIKSNSKELGSYVYVVDSMFGKLAFRMVIVNGAVTEIGEIVYRDNEPVGYELTITAKADADGNTAYKYIQGTDQVTTGE